MSDGQKPTEKHSRQRTLNLVLVGVLSQVGFLTLIIIFLALFGGLWLDNIFETRPFWTILLMVLSVPVTLFVMFWVVRKATARLIPTEGLDDKSKQEEVNSGRNSQET
jgi:hypothetical protein